MKPGDKSKRSNNQSDISKESEYNVKSLDMYKTSDAYKKRKDPQNTDEKIPRKGIKSFRESG